MREKLRRGEWSGWAPVGYLNDYKTHTIVIDPDKYLLVRKMFELYATGNYTVAEITKEANRIGLTGQRNLNMNKNTIHRMLRNPFYCGLFYYNGELHEGTHQPIISKEIFDKVQQILKTRGKGNYNCGKTGFVFRGFIRCAECGCLITAEEQKGYHYYHCTKKKTPCSQPTRGYLREENLADQIKLELLKIWLNDATTKVMLDKLEKEKTRNDDVGISMKLDGELKTAVERLNRLLDLCFSGLIDQKEYQTKKEELLKRKYEIKSKMEKFDTGRMGWLEPMKDFILVCNSVGKAIKENDVFKLKEICQKAGSNFKLSNKKLFFSFYLSNNRILPNWRGGRDLNPRPLA